MFGGTHAKNYFNGITKRNTLQLTISYVSRMLPTSERRKTIRGVHFLTCQCEMCKNEELDLIGLSSKCRTKNCTGFVKGSGNCSVCEKLAFLPFEQVSY